MGRDLEIRSVMEDAFGVVVVVVVEDGSCAAGREGIESMLGEKADWNIKILSLSPTVRINQYTESSTARIVLWPLCGLRPMQEHRANNLLARTCELGARKLPRKMALLSQSLRRLNGSRFACKSFLGSVTFSAVRLCPWPKRNHADRNKEPHRVRWCFRLLARNPVTDPSSSNVLVSVCYLLVVLTLEV